MSHIFVSYSRRDSHDVYQVVGHLKAYGFELWMDTADIPGGEKWKEKIDAAIKNCYVFIIMLSPHSLTSQYVQKELNLADQNEKFILPVIIQQTPIPTGLKTVDERQHIDLSQDRDSGIQQLQERIKSLRDPDVEIPNLENYWPYLLREIQKLRCLPILGPGIHTDLLPTIYESIALEMSRYFNIRIENTANLANVIRSLEHIEVRRFAEDQFVKHIKNTVKPDFSIPDEPHTILAMLPFDLYVTTNYDDSMLDALKSADKLDSRRYICRWKNGLEEKSLSAIDPGPTIKQPIVFHLFGHINEPRSLVLTEDDYSQYLMNVSLRQDSIPVNIQAELGRRTLLLLGFRPEDRTFQSLITLIERIYADSYKEILSLVQFLPIDATNHYIKEMRTRLFAEVYVGSTREFTAELQRKWEDHISTDPMG